MNPSTNYTTKIDTRQSMRKETKRPVKQGDCIYCDKQTGACRMKIHCISQDAFRFCGLPREGEG